MNKLFNIESPIMQKLSLLADLMLLNLLAVLCSIPIVTIGAVWAALYDATERLLRDEGGVFRAFFKAFKENFRQATILWLIMFLIGFAVIFSTLYFLAGNAILLYISLLGLLLWGCTVSWVFPLQAKFVNTVGRTLNNAVICALAYMPRSIVMAILNLLPLAVFLLAPDIFLQLSWILLVFWFSLVTTCSLYLLRKPYKRMIPEENVDSPAE